MTVEQWVLHLYVAGRRLALSAQAEANLRVRPVPFRKLIGNLANEERARLTFGCPQGWPG